MAFIKNVKAPASAPGYSWDTPESVVEVTDDVLVTDILAIPDGGFVEVQHDGKALPSGVITEPAPELDSSEQPETETRTRARRGKPVEETSEHPDTDTP